MLLFLCCVVFFFQAEDGIRDAQESRGLGDVYKRQSLGYTTCRAVDSGMNIDRVRRMISESKKFITESCQKIVHNAMQVVGGIGYTNVFPIERIYRDVRLASIWTGTSEVMSMIIAHEWYREQRKARDEAKMRDFEADAAEAFAEEAKLYE